MHHWGDLAMTSLPVLSGFLVYILCPNGVQALNEEQYQIIPDYSHDFASGPAVETQLSWLFLWSP